MQSAVAEALKGGGGDRSVVKEMQLSGVRAVQCSAVLCCAFASTASDQPSASASAEGGSDSSNCGSEEIVEPDRSMSRKGDIYIYIYKGT